MDLSLLAQHALVWLAAAVVLALAVAYVFVWSHRRSEDLITEWADRNDHLLLALDSRSLTGGPFLLTTLLGQTVYRATLRTPAGEARRAWVRCGSPFGGILVRRVEVYWDPVP